MSETAQHTVEVWSLIRPLWNFGAYWTGLFDWRALSAIAAGAAVVIALRRDTLAERNEMLREAATLGAMANSAQAGVNQIKRRPHAFPEFAPEAFERDPERAVREAEIIVRNRFISLTHETVQSVKMDAFLDAKCLKAWMVAVAALKHIEDDVELVVQGKTTETKVSVDAVEKAVGHWRARAAQLEYNCLPAWRRAITRNPVGRASTEG